MCSQFSSWGLRPGCTAAAPLLPQGHLCILAVLCPRTCCPCLLFYAHQQATPHPAPAPCRPPRRASSWTSSCGGSRERWRRRRRWSARQLRHGMRSGECASVEGDVGAPYACTGPGRELPPLPATPALQRGRQPAAGGEPAGAAGLRGCKLLALRHCPVPHTTSAPAALPLLYSRCCCWWCAINFCPPPLLHAVPGILPAGDAAPGRGVLLCTRCLTPGRRCTAAAGLCYSLWAAQGWLPNAFPCIPSPHLPCRCCTACLQVEASVAEQQQRLEDAEAWRAQLQAKREQTAAEVQALQEMAAEVRLGGAGPTAAAELHGDGSALPLHACPASHSAPSLAPKLPLPGNTPSCLRRPARTRRRRRRGRRWRSGCGPRTTCQRRT